MDQNYSYIFKIILIGDSGVGKTSLMNRYTEDTYKEGNVATIGVDFKFKTVKIGEHNVKLQIWDTAGQERYRAIVSNYYRGANGIFLVFDLLNRESFEHLSSWINELKKSVNVNTAEIKILGNKNDDKEHICVTKEDVNKFLEENGLSLDNYYEVSAKDNYCVEETFQSLSKKLVENAGPSGSAQIKKKLFKIEKLQKKWCC